MSMRETNDTAEGSSLPLDQQRFSAGLRAFHQQLAEVAWQEDVSSCVFIRDHEGLPDTAPFDIDIMVEATEIGAFRSIFEGLAETAGLVCITRNVPSGLHILVLDLIAASTRRTWAYYEIATRKKMTSNFHLIPREIAVQRASGLPVPDINWGFLINFLQAMRKGDMTRHRGALKAAIAEDPGCLKLCSSTLGVAAADILGLLNDSSKLDQVAERAGVVRKSEKPASQIRLRTRLRRAALRHLYFLPSAKMYTFTIHGADGVGKTTACNLVKDIFAGYPFELNSAHHVTSWKHRLIQEASAKTSDVSLVHKVLRLIYRASPQFARDIWVTGSGYHHYSTKVNAEVYRSYIEGKILLLDRYIYDLSVKDVVMRTSSMVGNKLSRIHCFIMRRPSLAILLQDNPNEVIKRKQELNEVEIREYQLQMRQLLERFKVRFKLIEVRGRKPEEIGREVALAIISQVGVDLHSLLRDEVLKNAQPAQDFSVSEKTSFMMSVKRIASGTMRRLSQFMLVVEILHLVAYLRFVYFYHIRRKMSVASDMSEGVAENTIMHNMRGIRRSVTRVSRSNVLIRPLSVIHHVQRNLANYRVLSIGPRSEAELLALMAHGFRASNIRGLDLLSYSPLIDVGDMHALEYQENSFDIVIASRVLGYSNAPEKAAAEMLRVVRDGGFIAINTGDLQSDETLENPGGYQAGGDVTFSRLQDLLDIFAPHVGQVYFQNDPSKEKSARRGPLLAIFSVTKDGQKSL